MINITVNTDREMSSDEYTLGNLEDVGTEQITVVIPKTVNGVTMTAIPAYIIFKYLSDGSRVEVELGTPTVQTSTLTYLINTPASVCNKKGKIGASVYVDNGLGTFHWSSLPNEDFIVNNTISPTDDFVQQNPLIIAEIQSDIANKLDKDFTGEESRATLSGTDVMPLNSSAGALFKISLVNLATWIITVLNFSGLSTTAKTVFDAINELFTSIGTKVDKITGKGLSTEDYTTAEKSKLANQSGVNTGDQDLSAKQDTLVSGTNIKTVNSSSLLGSGNIVITGGTTDHGALSGLADDDHTQYALADGSRGSFASTSHNHNLNDLTEKSYNSLTDKPTIPTISTDIETDGESDTKTASPKAVKTYAVKKNTDITGATKTKITYDAKGLVTGGADATTDDISEGSNNKYLANQNLGNLINAASAKTTLYSDDMFPIMDSQDENKTKKYSWLELWSDILAIMTNSFLQIGVSSDDITEGVTNLYMTAAERAAIPKKAGAIQRVVTSGSQVTVDFTGLGILANDGLYKIYIYGASPTKSLYMLLNGADGNIDTTVTNYYSASFNYPQIGVVGVGGSNINITLSMNAANTKPMATGSSVHKPATAPSAANYSYYYNVSIPDITKIRFVTSDGSAFADNMVFEVHSLGIM